MGEFLKGRLDKNSSTLAPSGALYLFLFPGPAPPTHLVWARTASQKKALTESESYGVNVPNIQQNTP